MTFSVLDAHQHFWRYDAVRLAWVEPNSALAADFLPSDLALLLSAAGVGETLAVQVEPNEAETRWLLALAEQHRWIAGVVGWTDLEAPDAADRLRTLAHPRLVGLRHLVQDEPDPDFLRRPAFIRGVREAAGQGLTYDLLITADQAPLAREFVDAVGEGRFVLDHGGKPKIRAGGWQPWADAMADLAGASNVWCKISGLVTEADHVGWTPNDIAPYLDHLLACFGAERLIYASDWPVCRLAASYAEVHALAADFVARRCPDHAASVFGGAARRAYALDTVE